MAGALIEIKVDTKEVQEMLLKLHDRLGDLTPAMKVIGEIVRTSIVRNFEKQGRPGGWAKLTKATVKMRGASKPILRRQGFAGGLMGSISASPGKDSVSVGTNKVYAAIHQFGAKKGAFGTIVVKVGAHNRRITSAFGKSIATKLVTVAEHEREMAIPWGDIPARPYMMIQEDDIEEIKDFLGKYIVEEEK